MKGHEKDLNDLLIISGEMANLARMIVGGRDITAGQHWEAAPIDQVSALVVKLREVTDRYDRAILRMHENGKTDR